MSETYVINIGRQLGSGGKEIGEKLAGRLGIKFYDKELIKCASEESGLCQDLFERADEHTSSLFAHLNSNRLPFFNMNILPMNDYLSNEMLFKIQSEVILNLAQKDNCLFVGRCADYILRKHPKCVNIFIHANIEFRTAQLIKRLSITEEKATALIEKTDKSRASYYNYYTDKTWGMASSYHLCIDSTLFGIDGTVDYLHEFIAKKQLL